MREEKSIMGIFVSIAIVIAVVLVTNFYRNRGIMNVNAQAAREMLADSTVTVLDVRTPQEFAGGHIKGARLIPVAELGVRINEVAKSKDRKILAYCHAGSRSSAACRVLQKNGFTQVWNLIGGMTAWSSAGNQVVRGN